MSDCHPPLEVVVKGTEGGFYGREGGYGVRDAVEANVPCVRQQKILTGLGVEMDRYEFFTITKRKRINKYSKNDTRFLFFQTRHKGNRHSSKEVGDGGRDRVCECLMRE